VELRDSIGPLDISVISDFAQFSYWLLYILAPREVPFAPFFIIKTKKIFHKVNKMSLKITYLPTTGLFDDNNLERYNKTCFSCHKQSPFLSYSKCTGCSYMLCPQCMLGYAKERSIEWRKYCKRG